MIPDDQMAPVTQQIAAVCPIYGISCDGRIDVEPAATAAQEADALAIMLTHCPDTARVAH